MALSAYTDTNKLADKTVSPNFWGGVRAKLKLISNTHHAQEVAIAAGETVGLAAGTAAIGKLAANSGVDIGDVDVTSLPALVAGTALIGKVIVDVPLLPWSANGDYTGAQTNTSLKAAHATLAHYITDIVVTNDSTAAITVKLLDGSGGANLTGTHKIAPNGGIVVRFATPIKMTAATALCLTTSGTSNFSVLVNGYTAA